MHADRHHRPEHPNTKHPNFRLNGNLYLVRCFACYHEHGRENYSPYVADGTCAWCGWIEDNPYPRPLSPMPHPRPPTGDGPAEMS